ADQRPRPGGPPGGVAGDPAPRSQRRDCVPDDAVPRRGREARRPDRDPARGRDHRVRDVRGAAPAAAARDSGIRGTAANPGGDLPGGRRRRQGQRQETGGTTMKTQFFSNTSVMFGRTMRHITRSPDTIITTAIMPIAFLLLFVYVFGGSIQAGPGSYVNYLLPGILLITIASGIS